MESIIYYLGTGLAAGIFAGMLGIGGGVVAVPLLIMIFTAQDFPAEIVVHLAIGTSLTAIMFTSVSSAWAQHREGTVDWVLVRRLVPWLIVGAFLGAVAAHGWTSDRLLLALGIAEIAMAVQIAFNLQPASTPTSILRWLKYPLAALIAWVSALVGISGGLFMVPLLLWEGLLLRKAIANSSACGVPIAVAGAIGFAVMGQAEPMVAMGVVGSVHLVALLCIAVMSVIGAQLGVRLAHRMPVLWLQRVFAVVLFLIGIKVLSRVV